MLPTLPTARHQNLNVQHVNGEILLFDTIHDQASVLNPTAAAIWELADGKTSVNDIALAASRRLNNPIEPALVWYTLEQLSKRNLMATPLSTLAPKQRMSRRALLRVGAVGAAVALPVIVSIAAPSVSFAASCLDNGQSCKSPLECCSETCVTETCQ